MLKKILLITTLTIPTITLAAPESKFLKLCLAGDRDALIIARHYSYGKDAYVCKKTHEILTWNRRLDISCEPGQCDDSMKLNSIDSISELGQFEDIDISGNNISDLSPLLKVISRNAENDYLQLDASNNPIKDFSPLSQREQYGYLGIGTPSLTNESFEQLRGITSISHLDISGSSVSSLAFLEQFPTLDSLDISYTQIKDLAPLAAQKSWYELDLNGLGLTEIPSFAFKTKIRALSLDDNKITDINDASKISGLETLWAENNKLTQVSLPKQFNIIDLKGNRISQFEFDPSNDYTWQYLGLADNNLSDISPLNNSGEPHCFEVFNNPLTKEQCLSQISNWYNKEKFCEAINISIGCDDDPVWTNAMEESKHQNTKQLMETHNRKKRRYAILNKY